MQNNVFLHLWQYLFFHHPCLSKMVLNFWIIIFVYVCFMCTTHCSSVLWVLQWELYRRECWAQWSDRRNLRTSSRLSRFSRLSRAYRRQRITCPAGRLLWQTLRRQDRRWQRRLAEHARVSPFLYPGQGILNFSINSKLCVKMGFFVIQWTGFL